MRTIAFFLFIFLLSTSNAQELRYKGSMGYYIDGLDYIKYKDAKLAFRLWMQELANNNHIDVTIEYYEDLQQHRNDYKNFKFDYMALNPYFFLENQDVYLTNSQNFWIVQKSKERFEKYVVLVRKDTKFKDPKDLKNSHIQLRSEDYISKLILDDMLLKTLNQPLEQSGIDITISQKYSLSILNVYFKKADACVVPAYTLDIVSELNPDIGKKLQIIYETPRIFFPIIAGFHNSTNQEIIKRFSKSVHKLETYTRGQNILDLFKMQKMFPLSNEELKPLLLYYKNYKELQRKYKKEIK